jgi:decaprenylphospho-beta-D-ribofuranose 2-oxidase
MILDSWGRYPQTIATVLEPLDGPALRRLLQAHASEGKIIPRGAGRSYGDSALAALVMSSRFLDSFLSLDSDNDIIHCGAGVNLDTVLKVAIPNKLFVPVLPGSKFVTVGGAIAADVHGKNHHVDGSFCDHVVGFNLLLSSGETVYCSETENTDLFHASCGGMGLTGIILDAKLKLQSVPGVFINRQSIVSENLASTFEILEENNASTYSVAWLDCLAQGQSLGRSLIFLGNHASNPKFVTKIRRGINVPVTTPSFLLNKYSMGLFNSSYFNLKKLLHKSDTVNYDSYFFPLDNIGNWNRLYGRNGFLQYQFVVPSETALESITEVLRKVSAAGKGSFLSVLKKFGKANKNWLSFPLEGYTLTLDFKREKSLFSLLDKLDEIVLKYGGRLYLAKDARMTESTFKQSYPNWEKFLELKKSIDPENVFSSLQSDRVGLTVEKSRKENKDRKKA